MVPITSIAFRRVSVPPPLAGKSFGVFTFNVVSLFLIICLVLTGTEKIFFCTEILSIFFSTAKLRLVGSYF